MLRSVEIHAKIAQNKLSSVVLTAVQTNVFSLLAKVRKEMDAVRRFGGKLFHTRGPATAKLRLPSAVLALGITRHLLSADRRCCVGLHSTYADIAHCTHHLSCASFLWALSASVYLLAKYGQVHSIAATSVLHRSIYFVVVLCRMLLLAS